VHILSATDSHAKEAIEHITSEVPSAQSLLKNHVVDLGSLNDIKGLIPTLAELPRIDLLFLIAGVGVAPFGFTKDGLGNHFAVNHLAGMLLVDGLLPKLIETSKSKQSSADEAEKFSTRIVVESSELHRAAPSDVKCESVEEFNTELDPTKLYGRSKLMG
jgi:WW domain-containing oxidoreductase